MDLSGQTQTFLITIAAGMVLGLLFDVIRLMRGTIRPGFLVASVVDLLYWLVATAIVFAGLLAGNWGEVRLYVFVGLMIGGFVYFRWLSKIIVAGLRFLAKGMCLLWRSTVRLAAWLFWPIRWSARVLAKPLIWTVHWIAAKGKGWMPRPPDQNPPADE